MLIDVPIVPDNNMDPVLRFLLSQINPKDKFRHVEQGIYNGCGFNFEHEIDLKLKYDDNTFPNLSQYNKSYREEDEFYISDHGVCDSIEQFKSLYGVLINDPNRFFCVGFTQVDKAEQSENGGWRWHKWGPYHGTQKSVGAEYLYDEPDIETVFTYEIIEVTNHLEFINGVDNAFV